MKNTEIKETFRDTYTGRFQPGRTGRAFSSFRKEHDKVVAQIMAELKTDGVLDELYREQLCAIVTILRLCLQEMMTKKNVDRWEIYLTALEKFGTLAEKLRPKQKKTDLNNYLEKK